MEKTIEKAIEQSETVGKQLAELWEDAEATEPTQDLVAEVGALTESLKWSVERASYIAASIPEEKLDSYLRDAVKEIKFESFEKDAAKLKRPVTVENFAFYVFRLTAGHLETLLLLFRFEAIKTFKAIVNEYAKENFKYPKLPKAPKPKQYVANNTKVMRKLAEDFIINGTDANITVLPDDGVTTYIMALYEDEDQTRIPFNLTPFEVAVFNAVCTIYRQAENEGTEKPPVVTASSIYQAMPGSGGYPSPKMLEDISAAVSKMTKIDMKLDATEELQKLKKISAGEKFSVHSRMLMADELTYSRRNGSTVKAWPIYRKPILHEYAERNGQLIGVPFNIVRIEGIDVDGLPDGVPLKISENRRELLAYLVQRVAVIKRAQAQAVREAARKRNREADQPKTWRDFMGKTSTTILFESATKAAGVVSTSRKVVKDTKDFVRNVFQYWKAKGFIFDFKEVREGRESRGVKIIFPD